MSGSVYSSESGSEDPLLVQLSATRARASLPELITYTL
jgi:hypothetical protein